MTDSKHNNAQKAHCNRYRDEDFGQSGKPYKVETPYHSDIHPPPT